MQRDILYSEIGRLSGRDHEVMSHEVQPSNIHLYNTDLSAPYNGGNFNFSYQGGTQEATITFNTYISYRKNYSIQEKNLFEQNLAQAVSVWDNAAELRVWESGDKYDTRIGLRFKLRFVKDSKYANKKTDVHPNGTWSSWFNGANREIVMRDLNVFIGSSRNVLVHEFGHVWGLMDEYDTKWVEKKFSPAHVGPGSPLLQDKNAIMNIGYQDEATDSGEFRTRYFQHFGRKILSAFWGIKKHMHPIEVKGRVQATALRGRIYLLKKDIRGNRPDGTNITTLNPEYTGIQLARRGRVSEKK